MRQVILAVAFAAFCVSCNKNKYTTAPQIKFKSITSPFIFTLDVKQSPILTIEITDAEGDIGFKDGKDTSYVYVKNLTIPPFLSDSFKFPKSISAVTGKDFKADVDVAIRSILSTSANAAPYTDTLFFEVYVKDFAKNKSNVIKTDKPLLYKRP